MVENSQNTSKYSQVDKYNLFKAIIEKIGSTSKLEELLNFICQEMADLFNVDRVVMANFDSLKHSVNIVAEYEKGKIHHSLSTFNYSPEYLNYFKTYFIDQGNMLVLDNIQLSDQPDFYKEFHKQMGSKSIITFPLIKGEDKWGLISLFNCHDYKHWTNEEITLLKELAEYIFVAIKQADLYATIFKQAETERLYNNILATVRETLDINEVKKRIVHEIGSALHVDRCIIHQIDPLTNKFLIIDEFSEYRSSQNVVSYYGIDLENDLSLQYFLKLFKSKTIFLYADWNKYLDENQEITNEYKDEVRKLDIKSNYIFPILYGDKFLANLYLTYTKQTYALTDKEVEFIKILTIQIGIAINQAQLYDKTKKLAEREAFLRKITEKIRSTLEAEQIIKYLVDATSNFLDVDRCLFHLFDREKNTFSFLNYEVLKSSEIPSIANVDLELEAPEFVHRVQSGKDIIIRDFEKLYKSQKLKGNKSVETIYNTGVKSDYGLSITYQDQYYGIIIMHFIRNKRMLTFEELEFLKIVRNQVGIALHQAEIYKKEKQTAEREELIRNIISTISSTLDLEKIKTAITQAIGKAIDLERCFIIELDLSNRRILPILESSEFRRNDNIRSIIGFDFNKPEFDIFLQINQDKTEIFTGNIDEFINKNNEFIIDEIQRYFEKFNVKGGFQIPLVYGNQNLGFIAGHHEKKRNEYSEEEKNFIRTLSKQTAIAIYQAKLYQKEKEKAEREALIRNIVSAISSNLDINMVKKSIVEAVGKTLHLDRCFILQYNPINDTMIPANIHSEYRSGEHIKSLVNYVHKKRDFSGFKILAQNKKEIFEPSVEAIIKSNIDFINDEVLNYFYEYNFKAGLQVPLFYGNQFLGVLIGHYQNQREEYSDDEKEFVRAVANQAGIAIYQASLYDREKQAVQRESLIRGIINSIESNLDINQVKSDIVQSVGMILKLNRCFIAEYDPVKDILMPLNNHSEYRSHEQVKSIVGFDFNIEIFKQFKDLGKIKFEMFAANDKFFQEHFKTFLTEETMSYFCGINVQSGFQLSIFHRDQYLGILVGHYTEAREEYTEDEKNFIRNIANQAGIAIYQARLYEKQKQATEREALAKDIINRISSNIDIEQVRKDITEAIGKALNLDRCFIIDYDPLKLKYLPVKKSSEYRANENIKSVIDIDYTQEDYKLFLDSSRSKSEIFEVNPELFFQKYKDYITDGTMQYIKDYDIKAGFQMPLVYQDMYLGVLAGHSSISRDEYTESEKEFLRSIANKASIVIYQAMLYEKERRLAEREALLRSIISAIGSDFDSDILKKNITESIGKTFKLDRCFICDYDPVNDVLLPVEEFVEYRASETTKSVVDYNKNRYKYKFFKDLAKNKQEVFIKDQSLFQKDFVNYFDEDLINYFLSLNTRAGFQLPLFYGNNYLGILAGHYNAEREEYTEEEKEFLRIVAYQAGMAIYQARLYEEQKMAAEREALAKNIISQISSNLNIEQVRKNIIESVGKALNLDRCYIVDYDPFKLKYLPVEKSSEYRANDQIKSVIGVDYTHEGYKLFLNLSRNRQEIIEGSVDTFLEKYKDSISEEIKQYLKEFDIKSGFQLPLVYQDLHLGFLAGHSSSKRKDYTDTEKEFLRTIANKASSVLYQSMLYEKECKLAEREALLRNIVSTIGSNLDSNILKKNITESIGKSLKLNRCYLCDYDPINDVLLPVKRFFEYRSSENTASIADFDFVNLKVDYFKNLAANKQEIFLSSAQMFEDTYKKDLDEAFNDYFVKLNVKAGFQLPLHYGNEFLGVIVGHYERDRDEYTEEEKEFLRIISYQAGIALYQARLFSAIKESEEKLVLYSNILDELNKAQDTKIIISNICKLIKNYLNLDAVGIRIQKGYDYPYFVTEGFSEEFIQSESSLCSNDDQGFIKFDSQENPIFECICGSILTRKIALNLPYSTPYGSFWTNSTTNLIPLITEKDFLTRIRNQCNISGYECVALIPLCYEDEVIGLLQLNNKAPDIFTLETIQFFEKIALSLAVAIKRRNLEESLAQEKNTLELHVEERTWALRESLIELNRKQAILDGINSILRETLLCESIEDICNISLSVAERLTGCNLGFILEKNPNGLMDVLSLSDTGWSICRMDENDAIRSLNGLKFRGFWKRIISSGRSLIVNNPSSHPDSVGVPEGHPEITSFIGVPLKSKGVAFGMIGLANKQGGFTLQDQETLELLATPLVEALNRKKIDLEIQQQKNTLEIINIELEKANKQKSEFLSSLSHELRTPLNAVIGFSDLLKEQLYGSLNPNQLNYVTLIKSSGTHLAELIDDLLDITRIDAGKLELFLEAYLPYSLIDEVIRNMAQEFNSKNLCVKTFYASETKPMLLDKKRFKQIVINLLSNAIKFTGQNGNITVQTKIEEGKILSVSVIDDGIGIPDEKKDNIFNEFYQIDTSVTRVTSGLGIGLALTKRLVLLHGGKITVQNAPLKGSIFTFSIPIIYSQDQNKNIIEQDILATLPRNKNILIAEDNEVNLKLIKDLLSTCDHNLMIAKNGQEAIDLAKSLKPDLILMDIKMPVMDGIQATQILRKIEGFENLPIIALTAFAGAKVVEEMMASGFTRHVSKPIDFNELFLVLNEFLG